MASTKRNPAFISSGYTYWKAATTAFKRHQASAWHREANKALVMLPQQIRGDIGELLSQKHSDQKANKQKNVYEDFTQLKVSCSTRFGIER